MNHRNQELQTRLNRTSPTVKGRRLTAYFAVFDTPTTVNERGQTFRELIRPGAFRDSLKNDVVLTLNHKRETTFATRTTGLILDEDDYGLFGTVYLHDTPQHNEIKQRIEQGECTGCSFSALMRPNVLPDGTHEITAAHLAEVCLAMSPEVPAYLETDVSLRTAHTPDTKKLLLKFKYVLAKYSHEQI